MRVLVAGGTGLIGRYAVLELIRRRHAVSVLARREPPANLFPREVGWTTGDLVTSPVGSVVSGFEGVVFAAGTDYRVTPRGAAIDFYRRVNVEASARLFRAAAEAGVARGVFVTSLYHAVDPALIDIHPYIRSRAESEPAALAACGDRVALCFVQPPFVIGRIDGRPSFPGVLARYVRSPLPLVAARGGCNFMSARSLGEAIVTALERGEPRAAYLVGDENLRWTDLIARFAAAAGRPRRVRALPPVALAAAARAAAGVLPLIGRESGLDLRAYAELLDRDFFFDPAPAQRALGYTTGNLDEAIAEAVAEA